MKFSEANLAVGAYFLSKIKQIIFHARYRGTLISNIYDRVMLVNYTFN